MTTCSGYPNPSWKSSTEEAFDNVWNNGLRCKIFQLDLPTKMTRSLSDFLVVQVIKVDVNGFLSNQINPKAGVPHSSVLSSLLFLIYVNDLPTPHHKQNSPSQFADDTAQWVYSLNVRFAAKFLQPDLLNLAVRCAKWSVLTRKTEPNLKLYGETLKVYPQVKCLGITFDSQLNFKKTLWGHPGWLQYQVPLFKATSQQKIWTYNPGQKSWEKW